MADVLQIPMVTTLHTPPTPWLRVGAGARLAARRLRRRQPVHGRRLARGGRQPGDPQRRRHRAVGAGPGRRAGRLDRPPGAREGAAPGHRRRAPGRDAAAARGSGARRGVRRRARSGPGSATTCATSATSTSAALCELVGSARVAVVTPDWEEPYGLVAAEAMACGTPVAALDRGAMREVVVEGGGVLADPRDPAALARGDGGAPPGSTATSCDAQPSSTARWSGWSTTTSRSTPRRSSDRGWSRDRLLRPPPRPRPPAPGEVLAEACRMPVDRAVLAAAARGVDRRLGPAGARRRRAPARARSPRADSCTGRRSTTTACGAGWRRCRPGSPSTGPRCSSPTSRSRWRCSPACTGCRWSRWSCRATGATPRTAPGSGCPASWCPSGPRRRGAWSAAWPRRTRPGCAASARCRASAPTSSPGPQPDDGVRRVVVLNGSGGGGPSADELERARAAAPGWEWLVLGGPAGTWVDDPTAALRDADVVVTHAGQNALAEVAAARRPAVVVPQDRPHDEQRTTAGVLARRRLARVVRDPWPDVGWGARLDRAARLDGEQWSSWCDGRAVHRFVGVVHAVAAGEDSGRCRLRARTWRRPRDRRRRHPRPRPRRPPAPPARQPRPRGAARPLRRGGDGRPRGRGLAPGRPARPGRRRGPRAGAACCRSRRPATRPRPGRWRRARTCWSSSTSTAWPGRRWCRRTPRPPATGPTSCGRGR